MYSEKGQSLIELVVSLAVAILVLGSLVFAIITSLRNAQLAKSSAQATKLAQEGLERVRSLRDRDGRVVFQYSSDQTTYTTSKFSDLWTLSLTGQGHKYFSCSASNCFFVLDPEGLHWETSDGFEAISNFSRQVQIEDDPEDGSIQKKVTAIVKWDDAGGSHESRLTTFLRKI